jgi:hypothetical protein
MRQFLVLKNILYLLIVYEEVKYKHKMLFIEELEQSLKILQEIDIVSQDGMKIFQQQCLIKT